ncbi:MAG: glycosyl hydrolase [Massilibacteroides sp.]|nr:glycosyl hydrolase [Massilibacteroides sp.]
MRSTLFRFIILGLSLACSCTAIPDKQTDDKNTLEKLACAFHETPMEYRPYVWWHWMGSNFSKEGITKDLEAMKEAGIGGATIFNLTSAVQESQAPVENNPWTEQTYRSKAYWEAMEHAASEAKRLGLKLGLQNTPGYSTTGGPWVTEKRGMQKIVFSKTKITGTGNEQIKTILKKPELPIYEGWGSSKKRATFYKDVAVIAVPEKDSVKIGEVIDVSQYMDPEGLFNWEAPKGVWNIFRVGHAPTMANPHPVPDDLIGKVLEADKMSKEQSVYHWNNVLNPLIEHLQKYIGISFTHILVDSYEAGEQNWTPGFRKVFKEQKGYDIIPWIALRECVEKNEEIEKFNADYKEVVSNLYLDNGWRVAKEMINKAGLLFFWEPYYGPFDTKKSVSIPDLPMGEFWTGGKGAISSAIVNEAKTVGKNLVGAEAFTGRPEISQYTEDPAFLKHSADGSFISGANWLFLHHWVHQPFDDQYQPGMGMGWWGTHFGRNQTWIKPGKAFFTYLSRYQMLLRQGTFVSTQKNVLHRSMPEAEIYFITNSTDTVCSHSFSFAVKNRVPELWYADKGVIRQTRNWRDTNDSTFVDLNLTPDESVFVVFPLKKENGYSKLKFPAIETINEVCYSINGPWDISFMPKLDAPFHKELSSLVDFSTQTAPNIKYFSGTAIYKKEIKIDKEILAKNKRIILDLGKLEDIAELKVNGQKAGVLWYPPYTADITSLLKTGSNSLEISVTNNWANRLIGDEQYPADFEWGKDRGEAMGRAMKAFPDWFITKQARPSKERKTFSIWFYYRKNSPLQPAGLIGPVQLVVQDIKTYKLEEL